MEYFSEMLMKRLDNIVFKKYISSVNKNQIYKQQYIVVVDYELMIDYADRVSDFLLNWIFFQWMFTAECLMAKSALCFPSLHFNAVTVVIEDFKIYKSWGKER